MKTEFHIIAIVLIVLLFITLRILFRKSLNTLGRVECSWYTYQALLGLSILSIFVLVTGYIYFSQSDPRYIQLMYIGILFIVYYAIFGKAAVGSFGILISGSFISWNKIYDYIAEDSFKGSVNIQFRWKESEAAAGDKIGRMIVPPTYRKQVEDMMNSSIKKKEVAS